MVEQSFVGCSGSPGRLGPSGPGLWSSGIAADLQRIHVARPRVEQVAGAPALASGRVHSARRSGGDRLRRTHAAGNPRASQRIGAIRAGSMTRTGRSFKAFRYLLASATLGYIILLTFPQVLFAYEVSHGNFKVYSREPLDSNIHRILDTVEARLAASGIHSEELEPRIFTSDSHGLYAVLGMYVGRNSFAKSYPLLPVSNVFVNRSDVGHDLVLRDAPAYRERSLSGVIAHEVTHLLVRKD